MIKQHQQRFIGAEQRLSRGNRQRLGTGQSRVVRELAGKPGIDLCEPDFQAALVTAQFVRAFAVAARERRN